jgi:RNA polymerase sigma-70 factor (ECF subfamily)
MSPSQSHDAGPSVASSARHGDQFQCDLIALVPQLRAFSRTLCRRRDVAEDLAQEALMNAWRARGSFQAGTNLKAWLFTILRNGFYSHGRRAWREAHWDAESAERIEGPPNKQDWCMELSDTARAMQALPDVQREAIILVGAGGFSYEEAAAICDSAVGTMKSRVARGRCALLGALDGREPLPQPSSKRRVDASDDIFAQLNALASAGTRRSAHA